MTPPILSVTKLRTSFYNDGAWTPVIRDISFDIAPKTTVAIVGESGSGKSMTALSIMRLLPGGNSKVEGNITLAGRSLLDLPEREMRNVRGNEIAMIFQEPMTSLNPSLTIGFQIAEALMRHRNMSLTQAEAEVIRLLDRVRIPSAKSRANDYPHRLSGGMRQRVMIAMALACKPKLLIADEPTTALDVTIQAQILELIRDLQDEDGMAVLFITHDMGVVAEIADRTIVMLRGDVVESGDTADIFANPQHAYTRSLLSAVPKLGSMIGKTRPLRFPLVDQQTGIAAEPPEGIDTVEATKPILEVKNLTKYFDIRKGVLRGLAGRVHAVENVSFNIYPGETLALVGESGCGKSTTGRSIVRLTAPTSGSIRLAGDDILNIEKSSFRDMRKRMQMIFQDPYASLNPRMRIGESIAEPMIAHGTETPKRARERVSELLKSVGMSGDVYDRYPHEFSGGQRQRICIARALSLGPQLIIADEAVSALDVSIKAQVINLMLDLQERLKLAFLFISHDMAVVERISHRVAVMYLGEIVEIGTRASVFGNPQHPYTRRLLSAVPMADPSRRAGKKRLVNDELKSPIRAVDYQVPIRQFKQVGPDHMVQEWGAEWG
ncbi:peptide/nickel transport system ATP-binding protein [Phyllobacterium ifriqiyense]|uniref:Glutathione import ATP-binding protein GsiA n=1 Tax=Phyllobacterium ifriqiyense TaxID=314238 RepID=A0ABU0S5Y5_9HYPH|nr:ABC transporter ATP-binding protein [Phyllobacterium ifriqiyense]MDQ0995108.1 peptide/nickel transport system ATP-binding protein [Phyllobacterium ifriqiyense]